MSYDKKDDDEIKKSWAEAEEDNTRYETHPSMQPKSKENRKYRRKSTQKRPFQIGSYKRR